MVVIREYRPSISRIETYSCCLLPQILKYL